MSDNVAEFACCKLDFSTSAAKIFHTSLHTIIPLLPGVQRLMKNFKQSQVLEKNYYVRIFYHNSISIPKSTIKYGKEQNYGTKLVSRREFESRMKMWSTT